MSEYIPGKIYSWNITRALLNSYYFLYFIEECHSVNNLNGIETYQLYSFLNFKGMIIMKKFSEKSQLLWKILRYVKSPGFYLSLVS